MELGSLCRMRGVGKVHQERSKSVKLATIDMPRTEARKAFLNYRRAMYAQRDEGARAEDEQIMRCYRALALGRQVVDIGDAIKRGGERPRDHLPRLAIARADETHIFVRRWDDGSVTYTGDDILFRWGDRYMAEKKSRVLSVRAGTLPDLRTEEESRRWSSRGTQRDGRAIVPVVPPPLRPVKLLKNYHILFEADWQPQPKPRDPALLKHLGGPIYAVVALWDVSPVEATVLGVTRN